jgi:nucleotide-binding universal stress UspA family protein
MYVAPTSVDARRMRRTIVCGLDGSPLDAGLTRIGARLAEVANARLQVVHVLGAPHDTSLVSTRTSPGPAIATWRGEDHAEAEALATIDRLCGAAAAPATERRVIRYGDPARRLASIAEQCDAMLILVGTRGRAARPDALLGSVSSRLAADAPCPVLVVAPELAGHVAPETWRRRTLVSGVDGSRSGWDAAGEAAVLASLLDGSLSIVSVGLASTDGDEIVGRVRRAVASRVAPASGSAPVGIRHEARTGDPAWELECVAAASTAPLVAIGSRGLGPWRDALLGSVARRLLQTARRPILILPATASLHLSA